MIGQYLSNTNESATIPILQNFLELNKAELTFLSCDRYLIHYDKYECMHFSNYEYDYAHIC